MANVLKVLYEVHIVWTEGSVPIKWRLGLIVKNGDAEDPGYYRGITQSIE